MPRKRRRPTPDQTACVIYARFSSDRQRDESIEDQVAVCSKWAAARGLAVVSVYADRAISGTSDERPQFLRMVADAERGAFSAVVVYKLDRFSRDRYDTAIYKKKLQDLGVRVESAMESIPDSPEGLLLESLISGMNEYYVRNLAQNVRRGHDGERREVPDQRQRRVRIQDRGRWPLRGGRAPSGQRAPSVRACGGRKDPQGGHGVAERFGREERPRASLDLRQREAPAE